MFDEINKEIGEKNSLLSPQKIKYIEKFQVFYYCFYLILIKSYKVTISSLGVIKYLNE